MAQGGLSVMFPFPPIDIPPGQEKEYREALLVSTVACMAVVTVILYIFHWCGVDLLTDIQQ